MTRSFFEFARPTGPPQPRWGDPDCSPPDTCFVNIVGRHRSPCPISGWVECIAASWGDRRAIRMGQQFPGWVQYPETPGGSRGPCSSAGSGPGSTSLEGNPLVTPPIVINAPFRHSGHSHVRGAWTDRSSVGGSQSWCSTGECYSGPRQSFPAGSDTLDCPAGDKVQSTIVPA